MGNSDIRWQLADDSPTGLFELTRRVPGKGAYRGLTFHEVEARTIINRVPASSRLPFRYTINAYRGCSHACSYCFARPTHEFLGFDTGRDFDTQIVVKVNAVELTAAETAPGKWRGEYIAMGTNTDPYQPAEGRYRLTRGIVEVLTERRNPFSILTKSTLVLRDLDLFVEAARVTDVHIDFSIGTLDEEVWRRAEPGTPHPRKRVEAVAKLTAAGVPSGVLMAPLLPGISDSPRQVDEVMRACRDAGAEWVTPITLHLRPGVREPFMQWLGENYPGMVAEYEELYRGRAYLRQRRSRPAPGQPPRERPPREPAEQGGEQLRLQL